MPANRLQRWPMLSAIHDTIYVAANVYPIKGTAVGERPVYLARVPGGVMRAPSGKFQFVYPKILAASNGRIHLVWAEFDSARHDVLDWVGGRKTTLWHAVFTDGGWSTPREILRASALEWGKAAGALTTDRSGALHVVVWAWNPKTSGVMHLREDSTDWLAEPIPYSSLSHETAIQALGDSILIAFVGDSFGSSDTTGVSVVLSPNRGVTWTSSTVIHRLAGRHADHPEFIFNGKNSYLVWAEAPPHRFGRDTLRVVQLDNLLRPMPVASVALPDNSSSFSVVPSCGGLSFLVETLSQSPQTFELMVSADGETLGRSVLPSVNLATFSGLGASSRSVVAVIAVRSQPATPAHAVLMTRPACPSTPRR
jgi:hypothetical protein